MKTINARGKACPEPVILTKACVDQGEKEIEVLLDNPVSASNVMRFLEGQGFGVQLRDDEGMLTVAARLGEEAPKGQRAAAEPRPSVSPGVSGVFGEPAPKETFSVFITTKTLGRSDEELGEILMKSFLGTLAQGSVPAVVALANEGVKLALYDSSSCDHLKTLTKKGVSVLVCGTCVNHFQIADQIGAGIVSNMFEIVESLTRADKVITL
ncbi:MAG: sulfurtransferase-like selenium metabolism protein YedF [Synergistaceae bacterium]|jgi:selenium metabolism protein YedF|nr:sulfurtransferase-like selenium metabolism protein YedF [Synergistaceae bacterium]